MRGFGEITQAPRNKLKVSVWCNGSTVMGFYTDGGYMFALKLASEWFDKQGADDWEVEDKRFTPTVGLERGPWHLSS